MVVELGTNAYMELFRHSYHLANPILSYQSPFLQCNVEKKQIIAQSNEFLFKWIQYSFKHQDLKNLLSLDLKLQWTLVHKLWLYPSAMQ